MGSISLSGVPCKCKSCKCIFRWHWNNAPFVDAEATGTCSNCLQGKKHDCIDERYDPPKIIKQQ